jgi:hypothetical protein
VIPGDNLSSINPREFKHELEELRRQYSSGADNLGCHSCKDCELCAACMFCTACRSCYRCTHCRGCQDCSHCSHCQDSTGCHGCAYCVKSENCSGSNYLTLSQNCADCNYCFGCVGLQRKDFHILNRQYTRQEYFELVRKLGPELGIK